MLTVLEENVLINVEADSSGEVIRLLTDLLVNSGYVKGEYADVVISREEQYPTGIPTAGLSVAIPHAFADDCVLEPSVGVATLARPVIFKNMFDPDEELGAAMVFLIALSSKDKNEQAENLGRVMSIFSDGDLLSGLYAAKSGHEFVKIMGNRLEAAP
ncbi:MAG: PTS sugar transporter subunit IIA [Treponema sp.]|jgi:PTS system galactitol-specific IIA component|nr:PTS sugar transporter subunit IIA [Treponema sp.]